jgi:PAS domain S-box-containing protein
MSVQPPPEPDTTGSASQKLLDVFFTHAPDGFGFIAFDEPVRLADFASSDAVLDYMVAHQRITHVNNAMLALYRVTRDQATDAELADLFTRGITCDRETWWRLFETGFLHVETGERRFDGSLMWVEADYGCFYDDSGRITGHHGIQRDMTRRKQSERALREAETRYRSLFEQSQDAVFIMNLDGQVITGNQRAAEMIGYSLEEMRGLYVNDLSVQPADSEKVRERLMSGDSLPLYERTFRRKDGSILITELSVALVRDDDGQPLHIQSVARDIRERRSMEDALRQSESRQRALLAAMPDLMFRMQRDGTYLDYHAVSSDDLAMPPDKFIGRRIIDVMPPEMALVSMESLERTLDSGEEQVFEYRLGNRGIPRYFEARMVACAPDEVLALVRDVTGRKEAEQREFALTLEKHRVQLITRFIQDASHEFRTPLAIINNSLFFLERVVNDTKGLAHIEKAESQIARMNRLVDMLLLISRLDSDAPLGTMPVDLVSIVHQCVTAVAEMRGKTAAVIHDNPDNRLPPAQANAEYLMHAIMHLLENALRFTPVEGEIHVRTGCQEKYAYIQVRDTGIGMDAEVLAHIFERFWRSDDAHSTPGLGLGLPIAQKIVELHGGKIEVESTPGSGSSFTVWLPVLSPCP